MSGRLILVVGPSGAGKDTLIALARETCRWNSMVVFPRRTVTRPTSEYEDHDTLSDAQFQAALRNRRFALSWSAHSLCYGIPAGIESDLNAGKTVVCNVSRTVIEKARIKFPNTSVVLITAPEDVLVCRLSSRRRPADGSQTDRLKRSVALGVDFAPDEVVNNVGPPEEAAAKLVRFIRGSNDILSDA